MDESNITITELAERVGTSRSAMSCILSGRDGVTLERAERIAKSLGVSLSEILGEKFSVLS